MNRTTKALFYIVLFCLVLGVLTTSINWYVQFVLILALADIGGVIQRQY
jgi:hypothetical protein